MMTIDTFARDYIKTWEDGGSDEASHTLSTDRADPGNWTTGICGKGTCCGSQHGVTAHTLAAYRGCSADTITQQTMAALTLDEAAKIAVSLYYEHPGLAKLPWDAVVASVMDFGWNAGPRQAILLLQRLIGVADDGAIGPHTVRAYQQWIASHGLAAAANAWADQRDAYYRMLVQKRPVNQKYLHGWTRRTAYFRPGTPWWNGFASAS